MLDIKFIVENQELIKHSIVERNTKADVDALVSLYKQKNELQVQLDELRAERNNIAKSIPQASNDDRPSLIEKGKSLKEEIQNLEIDFDKIMAAYMLEMENIPNILPEGTPSGFTDESNVVLRYEGKPTEFNFKAKDHLELNEKLQMIDFEAGAKVAGNKCYFLKDDLVLLSYALQMYAINKTMSKGFRIVEAPDFARNEILSGSGFNPRGEESNIYCIEDTDLSLIATSEISIGGMFKDHVFEESDLPNKYVAVSHCFRREAGAGGQSSKGLYRVHQFTKIEMYQFVNPDTSYDAHEEMREIEEEIFKDLEIPYQLVHICAGDLGSPAYKKYDIEAWMPGKGENGEYGEVTSTSNCTDFQSRRLNIKYKKSDGTREFVHTLNGTAIAVTRVILAIMENNQQEDGSIIIPKVLRPFMGDREVISV